MKIIPHKRVIVDSGLAYWIYDSGTDEVYRNTIIQPTLVKPALYHFGKQLHSSINWNPILMN